MMMEVSRPPEYARTTLFTDFLFILSASRAFIIHLMCIFILSSSEKVKGFEGAFCIFINFAQHGGKCPAFFVRHA